MAELLRRAVVPALAMVVLAGGPGHAAVGSDVFRRTSPGVGVILAAESTGSGFLVAPRRMLTAAHVVGEEASVAVVIDGVRVEAVVEMLSLRLDVAVLSLSQDVGTVLALEPAPPETGDEVFAIGAARGDMSITRGIVSRVRTSGDPSHMQTDAAINPGNSGGPLVDATGRVVGLVVSKLRDSEGMALAVPAADLGGFVDGSAPADDPAPAGDSESHSATPLSEDRTVDSRWALLLPAAGLLYLTRSRRREPRIVLGPVRITGDAAGSQNPRSGVVS